MHQLQFIIVTKKKIVSVLPTQFQQNSALKSMCRRIKNGSPVDSGRARGGRGGHLPPWLRIKFPIVILRDWNRKKKGKKKWLLKLESDSDPRKRKLKKKKKFSNIKSYSLFAYFTVLVSLVMSHIWLLFYNFFLFWFLSFFSLFVILFAVFYY